MTGAADDLQIIRIYYMWRIKELWQEFIIFNLLIKFQFI